MGVLGVLGFGLAGEEAGFVAGAEDVVQDGFDVGGLVAVFGEEAGADGVGVDDLEVEGGCALFSVGQGGADDVGVSAAAAEGGEGAADEGAEDFNQEAEAVAFVRAEGEQPLGGVGIGGGLALGIDGGSWGEWFVFPAELLDAAHGDGGGGPVDDDGVADGVGGGEAPGVGVGAEHGELAAEGDDLGEGGGAVGVGDVAALGGVHDVTAAPEVVEGVIDADLADAVLVGQLNAAVHGGEGDGLTELLFAVPGFRGGEGFADDFDLGTGDAAAIAGAEQVVEVEGFDDVVGADAVRGGELAEAGGVGRFSGGVAAVKVGAGDEVVVEGDGDDAVFCWHGDVALDRIDGISRGLTGFFWRRFV